MTIFKAYNIVTANEFFFTKKPTEVELAKLERDDYYTIENFEITRVKVIDNQKGKK